MGVPQGGDNWIAEVQWSERESLLTRCDVDGAGFVSAGLTEGYPQALQPRAPLRRRHQRVSAQVCAARDAYIDVAPGATVGCNVGWAAHWPGLWRR